MKRLFGLSIAVCTAICTGCSSATIYPDNPFENDPVRVRTVAVAPFLIAPDIAAKPSQHFRSATFMTTDGATMYYSSDFAGAFAGGLTNFPDIEVITPDRVERMWIASAAMGTPANPLATEDQARTIARMLRADAIIVGEVIEYDPFVPRLTLDWRMLYAGGGASASNVRDVERSGRGGGVDEKVDFSKTPLYAEQMTLDKEQAATLAMLKTYAESLDAVDEPYRDGVESILDRPWPRFIWFSAWAAMTRAYSRYDMTGK